MNRNQSRFIGMRKKHNKIKEQLICNSVDKYRSRQICPSEVTIELLDVSVGRFGDLHKYIKARVDYVIGIDPDKKSIIEAEKRLMTTDLNAELFVDTITNKDIMVNISFDIIVCNFTLHYFFESEEKLDNAMINISNRLKKGGYFIGTSLDGRFIEEHKDNSEYYKIDKEYTSKEDKFGKGYRFSLNDNPDSGIYFNENKQIEYVVDVETFIQKANKVGLRLIYIKPFENYKMINLKDWEKYISNMYFSFVFYKE